MKDAIKQISFSSLAEKWPSTFVSRSEVGRFTGGIVSPKTMANLDSQHIGPECALRFGKKIAYPVDSLIAWLEKRAKSRGTFQEEV